MRPAGAMIYSRAMKFLQWRKIGKFRTHTDAAELCANFGGRDLFNTPRWTFLAKLDALPPEADTAC
jgi:hypothetical protein